MFLMIVSFLKKSLWKKNPLKLVLYNLVLQLQCCNKIIANQICNFINPPHCSFVVIFFVSISDGIVVILQFLTLLHASLETCFECSSPLCHIGYTFIMVLFYC